MPKNERNINFHSHNYQIFILGPFQLKKNQITLKIQYL